jgi:hypothetical protein
MTSHEKREHVLAALTDHDGNPKPWLTAEEIGYSPSLKGLTVRQIAAALCDLRQHGIVEHGGVEWRLTKFGLDVTRSGL